MCDALAPDRDPVSFPVPLRLLWAAAHEADTAIMCMPGDWTGVHTYGSPRIDAMYTDTSPLPYIGTRWGHTLDLHTAWDDLGITREEAGEWSSRACHPEDAAIILARGGDPDDKALGDWMTEETNKLYGPMRDCPNLAGEAVRLRAVGCPSPWRAAYLRHLA